MLAVASLSLVLVLAMAVEAVPHDLERRLADVSERLLRAPMDVALHVERARVLIAMEDQQGARRDLMRALQLVPDHVGAVGAMAVLESRDGNDVAALQACRRAQSLGSADRSLWRLRGRILMRLDRAAEAAPAFAAGMADDGADAEQYLELARALAKSGADASALAAVERGLSALGPVVALVDEAAALHVKAGRFAAALSAIDLLRPHLQKRTIWHERRGRVFAAAGRSDLAAAERTAALHATTDEPVLAAPPTSPRVVPPAASAATPRTPQVLVGLGSTWRYRDNGTLPAVDWYVPTFDDTVWAAGPAQLGYGDGDEATVVASGPAGAYHLTTWFRHSFLLTNPATLPTARVRVLCDDGAVIYVNGVEVGRWNLHNGPISPFSTASISVSGAGENAFHVFPFDPALLVTGNNVIAVEIHQYAATSADISFDCEVLGDAGPISVVRGPYLQNGTPSSAVVRWRTDQPTATQLWLGASTATLQPVVFDPTLRVNHAATATGLAAETTYHYAIGDANGLFATASPGTLRTLPPVGAVRPLRVWALGDAGVGWFPQYIVRELFTIYGGGQPADAILMLGDNAYFVGTDREYQTGVFDVYDAQMRTAFTWSTLGNHDAASVNTAAQTGPYYDIFTLPQAGEAGGLPTGTEAYYAFDRGHVHFVCLDSMDSDRTSTGAMMTWLQADLANTAARWIVAFFHHPPYTFGSHHSDNPADSGGRLVDMRQIALPLLEAGGVDLVLSGHSHSYERSFLLDGHYGFSSTLQPNMVLDRGDGKANGDGAYGKATAGKAPHEGAVYVVAGSAGWVSGGPLNHPAMHVSLANLGSFVIDVDGDRLNAKFLGLSGVEDEFTLVKGEARTLFRDQPRISVSAGGRQDWQLVAGTAHANQFYVLAGSYGTTPGLPLFGLHIPLNPDPWLQLSLSLANSAIYQNTIGVLDGTGRATASLVLPPLNDPSLIGQPLWHAYVLGDGVSFVHASNAVKMTFAP